MNDKFRITKDASGSPVYTHNNEVVSKDVFDQRNAQSSAEQNEMRKPDAFDAEFDDMRAKAATVKKPIKKVLLVSPTESPFILKDLSFLSISD